MSNEMTEATGGGVAISSLPEEVQKKLAEARSKLQEATRFTATKIGVAKGGVAFKLPDGSTTRRFTGIIVAVRHANKNYPKPYMEGQITPADCAAVSLEADRRNEELKPLDESPVKYAVDCHSCARLKWGSAKDVGSGRGKQCTEQTLAAIYVPALGEELLVIEEKKQRGREFDNYIATVTERFIHPVFVQTEFRINDDGEHPFDQEFVSTGPTEQALVEHLTARFGEGDQLLIANVKNSLSEAETAEGGPVPPPNLKDTAGSSGRKRRED